MQLQKNKITKLKIGYINHAHDEYRHTSLIFKVLDNEIKKGNGTFDKEFRFRPQNVILKGYLDKEGFLIEKLNLKKFVEFVYSNEYMAKKSFKDLIKRIKNKDSLKIINEIIQEEESHADYSLEKLKLIMNEEDRHWGFAKKFYDKKFPKSNLAIAFAKEKIKNKMRLFYFKNFIFLNKIFDPIINFFIFIFGRLVTLLEIKSNNKKNLLKIDSESII